MGLMEMDVLCYIHNTIDAKEAASKSRERPSIGNGRKSTIATLRPGKGRRV